MSNSRDGEPSVDEVLPAAKAGKTYRLIRHADGSVEIEAKSQADHDRAMNAVERIGPLMDEPYIRRIMAEAAARTATPVAASPASTIPTYPIGKVVAQWLADIKPNTLRKTLTIKAAAVEGFARHYGEKNPLAEAGRLDVGRWVEALRASGLQTPTIANKTGYLHGFFDWAKARGLYPSFAKDGNPAAGQVIFRTK